MDVGLAYLSTNVARILNHVSQILTENGAAPAPQDARAISIASFDRPSNGDRAQDLVVPPSPDHNIVWSGE